MGSGRLGSIGNRAGRWGSALRQAGWRIFRREPLPGAPFDGPASQSSVLAGTTDPQGAAEQSLANLDPHVGKERGVRSATSSPCPREDAPEKPQYFAGPADPGSSPSDLPGIAPSSDRSVTRSQPAGTYPAGRGFAAVRVALGLLLLAAAGMKVHELLTYPTFGSGWLDARWAQIAVVEFELFLGLWLLSGLFPRLLWSAAVACFSGFGLVALYRGITGEASCGCFGHVEVNPWWTLGLDTLAVAALLRYRPPAIGASYGEAGSPWRFLIRAFRPAHHREIYGAAALVGLALLVGAPLGWRLAMHEAARLDDLGLASADGSFVVLEPERWADRPFALIHYADLDRVVLEGEWMVLVVRPGCPFCERLLARWPDLAGRFRGEDLGRRVALLTIEEPPPIEYRETIAAEASGVLDTSRDWLVETPLIIGLVEGAVVAVVPPADIEAALRSPDKGSMDQ